MLTAFANTTANRRLTFGVRGGAGLARHQAAGLLALGVALAITSASLAVLALLAPQAGRAVELAVLALLAPQAGRAVELAVLVAANGLATLVRFLILRLAIERNAR